MIFGFLEFIDNIDNLKESAIFQILDNCPRDKIDELAEWIIEQRPDLNTEVTRCLFDLL